VVDCEDKAFSVFEERIDSTAKDNRAGYPADYPYSCLLAINTVAI
jgi:hypothetical protein